MSGPDPSPPPLEPPPTPGSQGRDRQRLEASGDLSPLIANFARQYPILKAIGQVRSGRAAISLGDRSLWAGRLETLDGAQRNVLRDHLVNKPPHPALAQLRGTGVLKGPATVDGLLAILTGEAFRWSPAREAPPPEWVSEATTMLAKSLDEAALARWRPVLADSAPLVRLVQQYGRFALSLVETFGLPFTERVQSEWAASRILGEAAIGSPALLANFEAERRRVGDEVFLRALEHLDQAASGLGQSAHRIVQGFGVAGALRFGLVVDRDPHAARALRSLIGGAEVLALGARDLDELGRRLEQAGREVAAFGPDGTPLLRGARWPQAQAPGPELAAAQALLLKALDLPPEAFSDPARLSADQLSTLIRGLRRDLVAREGNSGALEGELLGRRFISYKYYDALYDDGVMNPEHRYSRKTFEAWRNAAGEVQQSGDCTRGRPLQPGEFTSLMQEFHRRAGLGMVEVHESHLKQEDLGRLRNVKEDHVQLGGGLHEVDERLSQLLDQNPYLQRLEGFVRSDGTIMRQINFAAGQDVPKMVAELDAWVRENEGRLPPLELAAAVHHRLVSIHPFMDGNGRTSKLMVDFLLARAGIEAPLWREGEILKDVSTWSQKMETGLRFHFQTALRHWQQAVLAPKGPA